MGVFNNNPKILQETFDIVSKAISAADVKVKVFIHGYSSKDTDMVLKNVDSNGKLFNLAQPINRDTFKRMTISDL